MLFISLIGMSLPLSVIGLAIIAAYCVWLMLNGFPLGWGIGLLIFCLYYMAGGFKLMKFFTGEGGIKSNAAAAACLVPLLEVAFGGYFISSVWPYQLSGWWALLLPLTFLFHLLLQGVFEILLDSINPVGKRK